MKATLDVDGMHCASCALAIDERLEDLAGVEQAATSYRRRRVKVRYDAERVALEDLQRAIGALGYEARLR